MKTKLNKKAVVFDLDGTIIDTIKDIAAAVNRAANAFGFPDHSVEEVTSFLGNGSLMLMRRVTNVFDNDELCFAVRERFRAEYEAHMFDLTVPYEGIAQLFSALRERGVKIAVITNKDDHCAVPMIERFFGGLVDVCRGVRADNDRKPNPDVTLSVLDSLGVSPDEAIFVGDGMADVNVSKNCDIELIPVGYGYTAPEKLEQETGIAPAMTVGELAQRLLSRV